MHTALVEAHSTSPCVILHLWTLTGAKLERVRLSQTGRGTCCHSNTVADADAGGRAGLVLSGGQALKVVACRQICWSVGTDNDLK